MTMLPSVVKLRAFLIACVAWLLAGAWLVGCVLAEAPLRYGVAAAASLVLCSVAVWFVKHELEMDAIRARASRPGGEASMDGNGWD